MARILDLKFRRPQNDDKAAPRLYIGPDNLIKLTGALDTGILCTISTTSQTTREATVWLDRNLKGNVFRTTAAFEGVCGFSLQETYQLSFSNKDIPTAERIVLTGIAENTASSPLVDEAISEWKLLLKTRLWSLPDQVFSGLEFKDVDRYGVKRSFRVKFINNQINNIARFDPERTVITFADHANAGSPARLEVSKIPGLESPIEKLNDFLLDFQGIDISVPFVGPRAIVIHGDHGCGKTTLLEHVAQTGWGPIHRIEYSDKLSTIRETFRRAREQQPSIVIIDKFEKLVKKEWSDRGAFTELLCDELDKLEADDEKPSQVVVVVSCLDYQVDIHPDLRKRKRLHNDIFLPLPDPKRRRDILEATISSKKLPLPPGSEDETITRWSEKTHAYNGEDLQKLLNKVCTMKNHLARKKRAAGDKDHPWITDQDFDRARSVVRPTAMHEVNLKPPPTHWDDICGQEEAKKALKLAVRKLNEKPEVLRALGLSPPKGIMLYGPPGCSKTMAARAMATESGLNFFAVKGAELLNSYVGESERAIRQLFQRARGAAPSMIFFDEIDAIGSRRSGMGGSATTTHSGLHVDTTLLTEMDGFEDMKDVLVLAATNRPQVLDPALLRPGRFDQLIYVSLPDQVARAAMFRNFLAGKDFLGVDVDALVSLTEGFSGAEITGICQVAANKAYERLGEDGSMDEGGSMADFTSAVAAMPKGVTPGMLQGYSNWANQAKF